MGDKIPGINRTSLWKAWKAIRPELKKSPIRDVVDFLEYDINPEIWIGRLLTRLEIGLYEPETPTRFPLAKSKGFSRRMTLPHVPDLVLYRAIVDFLYVKVKRFEHKYVYFERGTLPKDTETTKGLKTPTISTWARITSAPSEYDPTSKKRFRAWLYYNQYRKFLVFKKVYPFIVTTDITNFFDSILFSRISEFLHAVSAPPRMIGLLFFMLERISIRDAFVECPRIGLPVDQFDCSRKLAHMVLFPHDDRIVKEFGEGAFIRWMDDQNVGVDSFADGLRALGFIGNSLGRLHLTPNAKKSDVLSLSEARRHYRRVLANARIQLYSAATDRYQILLGRATSILAKFLDDPAEQNRFRAALALLNMAGCFRPLSPKYFPPAPPPDDSQPLLPPKVG